MSVSKQWTNQKTPEAGQAFVYSSKLTWQLPLCKNPPSLVTVATFDKPCRSHATRYHVVINTSRSRQEMDYTPVSAFLRNSNNKWSCVALKCVVKDHCIALIVQAAHVNRSSFRIYLKHEIKQEWTTMYFISTTERRQYAEFFKFKSTEVNLLSCLICLSGKMADSALLLVRSHVNRFIWRQHRGILCCFFKTTMFFVNGPLKWRCNCNSDRSFPPYF